MNPIKLAIVICAFCTSSLFGDIIYVDSTAPGGDGTSWIQAFTDLQDAFDAALDNGDGIDEIWVAGGTYLPTYRMDENPDYGETEINDRAVVLVPWGNVEVYGGFAGHEIEREQRDIDANPTIISGDINGDDLPNWQNREDNAYTLFMLHLGTWTCGNDYSSDFGLFGPFTIDGFTMTGAHLTESSTAADPCWRREGGAVMKSLSHYGFNGEFFRITLRNCIVKDNYADPGSAANGSDAHNGILKLELANPITMDNVQVIENVASRRVVWVTGSDHEPSFITNCNFSRNGTEELPVKHDEVIYIRSGDGGNNPIYELRPGIQVTNCSFNANVSNAVVVGFADTVRVNNCIFAGNIGKATGGFQASTHQNNEYWRGPIISNSLVVGNYSAEGCGGVVLGNSAFLNNTIVWGNIGEDPSCGGCGVRGNSVYATAWTPGEINSCLIQGLDDGTAGYIEFDYFDCFDADPMLMNPWGGDGIIGTYDDDYRLGEGSPCIDRGNNEYVLVDGADLDGDGDFFEPTPLDYNYSWRFMDVTTVPDLGEAGNGYKFVVDLGPLEVPACPTCPGDRFWVNEDGGFWSATLNWYPAKPGPASNTYFDIEDTYTVTLDEDAFSSRLLYRAGNVTFDLAGHEYELNNSVERSFVIENDIGVAQHLTIANGLLKAQAGIIAPSIDSQGHFNVENGGHVTFERGLSIGRGGYAELNINDGGYVISRDLSIGDSGQGRGVLNINGGDMDVPFFALIDNGTLNINGGSFSVGYLETIVFDDGLITGDGYVYSDVLNFGSVLPSMANGNGSISVFGNYEQVSAVQGLGSGSGDLQISVGAVERSELIVYGSSYLGGGLVVELLNGYEPSQGDEIRIVSCSDVEGQFDIALMPGLNEGKYMKLGYDKPALTGGLGGIDIEVDEFSDLLGFNDPNTVPVEGTPTALEIGDFDNDGIDDVAMSLAGADEESAGDVLVLISDGAGGFEMAQQIHVGANPVSITAGDFDGDGYKDIAVACATDNAVSVLSNLATGDGSFDASWSFGVGNNPRDVEAINLNNDSAMDLVVAASDDDVIEMWVSQMNLHGGGFGNDGGIPVGDNPVDIDPGDVNNDKDLDVFISVANYDEKSTTAIKGTTALMGSWITETIEVGELPSSVRSEDVNYDGELDIIVTNQGDETISVVLASTNGSFLPQVALPVGELPASPTVVDFDDDGDLDIAVVASNDAGERVIHMLRSDLNLTGYEDLIFASAAEYGEGEATSLMGHGDMDGDGLADLVTISEPNAFTGIPISTVATRENVQEFMPLCEGDLDESDAVGVDDLLILIANWGPCTDCPADLNGDTQVSVDDLLILIANWGPCESS